MIPPFDPDYTIIVEEPRDWSGVILAVSLFFLCIMIGALIA